MKRSITALAVFILVLLSLHGFLSCRAIRKTKIATDSTVVRTQVFAKSLDNQSYTEMIIEQEDLGLSAGLLPQIFGVDTSGSAQLVPSLSGTTADSVLITSKGKRYKSRLIFRQSTKKAESESLLKKEAVKVSVERQDKTRQARGAVGLLNIALATITLLCVICILIRSKQNN